MRSKKTVFAFILMTILAVTANAQQYNPKSDFSAKIIDNGRGVEIIKYTSSQQTVNIPPTIEGIPVTSIGREAFLMCTKLTSITMPNSITNIGKGAFFGCTGLTSINIHNNITRIEDSTFSRCTSLTSVTIGNSVTRIGQDAFGNCINLTSVTFQGGISNLGDSSHGGVEWLPFDGDLRDKYRAEGIGTYKTIAPVSEDSVWRKQ